MKRRNGKAEKIYIPTDKEILESIYRSYYDDFMKYTKGDPVQHTRIYVPTDIQRIANELSVDREVIFGILYYHMEDKYGYTDSDGSRVHFFALQAGKEKDCVNFPYLSSVLAELRDREEKCPYGKRVNTCSRILVIFSLVFSIVAVLVSLNL